MKQKHTGSEEAKQTPAECTTPEPVEEQQDTAALQQTNESPDSNVQDDAIARLQADLDRFRELAMRSQADLDNFRKRTAREREEAVRFANASLIESLLPVLDNFALGLEAAAKPEGGARAIHEGLAMVHKQLLDVLAANGLETIESTGRPFDPNLHEALAQEPSEEVPEGMIIRELRKGYLYRGRLLRASNVIVSSGKPAA